MGEDEELDRVDRPRQEVEGGNRKRLRGRPCQLGTRSDLR